MEQSVMKQSVTVAVVMACVLAWGGFSGIAHAMTKDLQWVRPRVGQRGTTVEVVLQGMYLGDPRELLFHKPGIRAVAIEPLPKLPHPIGLAHGGRVEEQVKAVLEIAPDCEPGEHPFRLRTARGLSMLASFHVTPFPVVAESTAPNDTIATAQLVATNVTVSATVDTDVYKVPVSPGQRLSVAVDCVRIADVHYGDAEFDLALRILDEAGRELAANDDNALHVQDPLVSLKVPEGLSGGHLFVEVRQSIHKPSDIPYCVHIGTFQRPLAVYPAGGQVGESLRVTFLGDPLGEFNETLPLPRLPEAAWPGTLTWFGDGPSPLELRCVPFGNVLEDPAAEATGVPQLPIALNGIIEQPGDTDTFRFSVKRGDRYRVRVFASALGFPVDPAIRIRPIGEDGRPGPAEVEADDSDARMTDRDLFGHGFRSGGGLKDVLDPSVIWEPKADGDYLLDIRDTSGAGGPTSVYRVEIESPPNAIHPFLASRSFDWVEGSRATSLAVPQGNRWTVLLTLPKGQGSAFNGAFDLIANGLPEGVRLVAPRVPGNAGVWPVQLVADANARPAAHLVTFQAKSTDPQVTITGGCQQAVPFVNHSGGDAWRTLRVDRFMMAVTEPSPISIDLVPPTASLVRGGELFIPVKLSRQPGFNEPVEFQVDFAPAGVGLPPKELIAANQTEAVLRIAADRNAPLGKGPLYVMATTLDGHDYLGSGRVRVSSELIEIDVAEPFVELASEPTSVRRGGRAKIAFSVTPKSPFEGEAEVKLLGLPKGVSLVGPLPRIRKETTQIAFEVEATDDALLGPVAGLECELIVKAAGQEIRQRAGKGTLRIDPRL
jgi:hypothetical protein